MYCYFASSSQIIDSTIDPSVSGNGFNLISPASSLFRLWKTDPGEDHAPCNSNRNQDWQFPTGGYP